MQSTDSTESLAMENNLSSNSQSSRKKRVMMIKSLFLLTKRLLQDNHGAAEIMRITGLGKAAVNKVIVKISAQPNASFAELYSRLGRNKKDYTGTVTKVRSIVNEDQSLTQRGIRSFKRRSISRQFADYCKRQI